MANAVLPVAISPLPIMSFSDSNGNPLSGGLLFTYGAGTTTKQNTFTDASGTTANTNPVVLNSRGEAPVWLLQGFGYKFVLSPSTDTDPPSNPIWTIDNLQAGFGAVANNTFLGNSSGGTAAPTAQTFGSGFNLSGGVLTYTPRGFISGLILSNDTGTPNTILDISAGIATDSTNTTTITLSSAITKTTGGPWAAGTGNAGMGTGLTVANTTWYHVFAITNGGVGDVYLDTSITAANAPSGTTAFRRIGSVKTDSSAHLLLFAQNGDRFDWGTPVAEFNSTPAVTTAVTQVLNGTPLGTSVQAMISGYVNDTTTSSSSIYISALSQTNVAASASANTGIAATTNQNFSYGTTVVTNTTQQIRFRCATTTLAAVINTNGYIDQRGRLT